EIDVRVASGDSNPGEVVELRASKPKLDDAGASGPAPAGASALDAPALAELAAATQPREPQPQESDVRMRRPTNPVDERRPSSEALQFAGEAKAALTEASKDMAALPREAAGPI